MKDIYAKAVETASAVLSEVVCASLQAEGHIDAIEQELQPLIREVGRRTEQRVLQSRAVTLVEKAQAQGMTPQRRPMVSFTGLYGTVEIESPYLWDPKTHQGSRPVHSVLGIEARGRSQKIRRALSDFGAEHSFGRAAKQFEEHYGFAIGRTSVLRVVEAVAQQAEHLVDRRLAQGHAQYELPVAMRKGTECIVVELDGCEIRTGTLQPAPNGGVTPVRQLPKRIRITEWKDVRMGLARRLDEVEPTYVGGLDKYEVVVKDMFGAACLHGLSTETKVVACGDGGNGLSEEIKAQFPSTQYILDRPHVKSHLYQTADAMGLEEGARHGWVDEQMQRLDGGHVYDVLKDLSEYLGAGKQRVENLHGYLTRFRDAVGYEAYRERGWPTGSGEIESAHRVIPQPRLKLPGAWWHPTTVNPMLALRLARANGWWEDLWEQPAAA